MSWPYFLFSKNHAKSYAGKLLLSYVSFKNTPHGIDDGTVLEEKWAKFLHEWRGKGSPTLFFVKTDIKDAYPSVKISKLLDILNQWCSIEEKLFLLSYKSQVYFRISKEAVAIMFYLLSFEVLY